MNTTIRDFWTGAIDAGERSRALGQSLRVAFPSFAEEMALRRVQERWLASQTSADAARRVLVVR